jgi:hypothetical protein
LLFLDGQFEKDRDKNAEAGQLRISNEIPVERAYNITMYF